MLIDNRHGGPIHIPHADGVLSLPPGIALRSATTCGASHEARRGGQAASHPQGAPADLALGGSSPRLVHESPLSIIPRIFSRELLAPFMSHEDGAVRKAAIEQDDLIKSRTGG